MMKKATTRATRATIYRQPVDEIIFNDDGRF